MLPVLAGDKASPWVRRRSWSRTLLQAMEGDYSASTINHVRQFLVGAFNRAREAGKWLGANPAEPVRTRRGAEQVGDILRPEELAPFLAALEPDQRPVFATAIFTGLRKGELCGLQKTDVDLGRRLLVARRSYARPYPKSRKQRVVRFPDELVPLGGRPKPANDGRLKTGQR